MLFQGSLGISSSNVQCKNSGIEHFFHCKPRSLSFSCFVTTHSVTDDDRQTTHCQNSRTLSSAKNQMFLFCSGGSSRHEPHEMLIWRDKKRGTKVFKVSNIRLPTKHLETIDNSSLSNCSVMVNLIPFARWRHIPSFSTLYTGWLKKVSCCTVIDISMARQQSLR